MSRAMSGEMINSRSQDTIVSHKVMLSSVTGDRESRVTGARAHSNKR